MTGPLSAGLDHHRAGKLAEAERCYRDILTRHPDHPDALHLLGLIAQTARRFDAAIGLIARAIAIAPGNAAYRYNLGVVLRDAGQPAAAVDQYREAVRLRPDHADAFANLGVVLTECGHPAEALAACDAALALKPDHATAHFNRGNALRALARYHEALAAYDQSLRLSPAFAAGHANRGIVLGDLNRWPEAADSHRRAIALAPDGAGFHYNLGIAARAMGQSAAAVESYSASLRLDPSNGQAFANRGNALVELGRLTEALADLNQAVALRPEDPDILYNRGVALEQARRFADAIVDYRRALSLRPSFPECAHNLSLTLLLLGQFAEAWPLHEQRWFVRGFPGVRRDFAQPAWTGGDLGGRTLLIYADQGFGDAIQFSRYIPLIRGGRVILEVPRALVPLMTGMPGADRVVPAGGERPAFDTHCALLSLPAVFGTTADTIPPPAVLPGRGTAIVPTSDGLNIGLVWSGNPSHANDRNRSMPLRAMLPLLAAGRSLFSLQTFVHDADRAVLRATPAIGNPGESFRHFADTASAIEAMDLVISVDTSVAHLAGSLGKPVWILLPFRPEWRWQLDRTDSPWYLTARLFRQRKSGDWDNVIASVEAALRAFVPTR